MMECDGTRRLMALRLVLLTLHIAFSQSFAPEARQATPSKLQFRGPQTPPPFTENELGNRVVDGFLYRFFRGKLVDKLGQDNDNPGFAGLIDLIKRLNVAYASKRETEQAAQDILRSLLPSWLPHAFKIMFARPLPGLSAVMNAWITQLTTFWLMGESELIDVETDRGRVGKKHGLLVKRCRYLEEAACASVCLHTCKVPTQRFFNEDMGLPLTVSPNYDTFECEFAFGRSPPPSEEDEAFQVACFAQCPTAKVGTLCNQVERGIPAVRTNGLDHK